MSTECCLITTTCHDLGMCDLITKTLLEKRLISCVQRSTMNGSFHWEGKIINGDEFLLQMKSKISLYKEVEAEILKMHDYEPTQILMYEIKDGSKYYIDWIKAETK